MKKILSIALVLVMLVSVVALAGCGKKTDGETTTAAPAPSASENLKFGMGVYATAKGLDAEDAAGSANVTATVAAVLLDADGKIVKCAIDTADNAVAFNADGTVVAPTEFKTKYEIGADYGMVAYAGAAKEWFQQADAFCATAAGKTLDEVKAFVAENGVTSGDLATAGCTINAYDFIKALEKAVANAKDSKATKDDTLKVAIVSNAKTADYEDANGYVEYTVTFSAVALDADKKVTAAATDELVAKIEFDAKGIVVAAPEAIKTKLEIGADYGMVAYAGAAKEWFEQAAAYDAACIGKTATEIAAIAVDGYGNDDVKTAGCTIYIGNMVKTTVKAATVA